MNLKLFYNIYYNNSMNKWQDYLKAFRAKHTDLSYKQCQKSASFYYQRKKSCKKCINLTKKLNLKPSVHKTKIEYEEKKYDDSKPSVNKTKIEYKKNKPSVKKTKIEYKKNKTSVKGNKYDLFFNYFVKLFNKIPKEHIYQNKKDGAYNNGFLSMKFFISDYKNGKYNNNFNKKFKKNFLDKFECKTNYYIKILDLLKDELEKLNIKIHKQKSEEEKYHVKNLKPKDSLKIAKDIIKLFNNIKKKDYKKFDDIVIEQIYNFTKNYKKYIKDYTFFSNLHHFTYYNNQYNKITQFLVKKIHNIVEIKHNHLSIKESRKEEDEYNKKT